MIQQVYFLFIFLSKFLVFLVFLLLMIAVGVKLWIEPVKGVCKCTTKLSNKVALVTGGNSGIGLETARDLAKRGATVIIASRDVIKSEKAVCDIKKTTGNNKVEFRHLNLGKFSSIREFAEEFNDTFERLDILVNNAGFGGNKRTTEHGIDYVMQINYFGPFFLTNLLLDKIKATKNSRIVIVSSAAHMCANLDVEDITGSKTTYGWTKYSNSKLCDLLWAKALSKRLPDGITANSLHPGIVKTDIFNNIPGFYRQLIFRIIDLLFKNCIEGAQTSIHLCVAPQLANVSGDYFSDCERAKACVKNSDVLAEQVWNKTVELLEKITS